MGFILGKDKRIIFQTGSGAHVASYHVDTGVFSARVKRPVGEAAQRSPSRVETKSA
jgi:hypothetical protein